MTESPIVPVPPARRAGRLPQTASPHHETRLDAQLARDLLLAAIRERDWQRVAQALARVRNVEARLTVMIEWGAA